MKKIMLHLYTIINKTSILNSSDDNPFAIYMPIMVSIIALIVSYLIGRSTLKQLKKTNELANYSYNELEKSNKRSVRPFFTIENGSKINDAGKLEPVINELVIRVSNAPAKIINTNYLIYFIDKGIDPKSINPKDVERDNIGADMPLSDQLVYFPDEKVLNKFTIGMSLFRGWLRKISHDNQEMLYLVTVQYSPIDSNDIYTTIINQKLEINEDGCFWKMISISAT